MDLCRPKQWPTISKDQLLPDGYVVYGANGPIGFYSEFTHAQPTIAVTCRGATCGTLNLVPPKCYITGNAMALDDPDKARVHFDYLHQALVYRGFADVISGSAQPQITRQGLAPVLVPLPPLPEQRKIAAILSSIDDAIEATQAVIDQLRVVKKAMMAELLTRGLPGRHTRFKQTEIGEVPEGWPMPRFEEITARITYGFTNPMPTTESGPWMVTAANVRDGWIDWDSVRYTDANAYQDLITDKSRPIINDVLITKDGTLGRVALLDRDNVCMNQSVASLRPIPQKVLPAFLAWSMRGPQMQERIIGDAGGSTIKHIYISKLAKTPVPIPPMAEQLELVSILENVEARMRLEEATSRALTILKSALSSALLTGEIRVKTDEATP